MKQSSKLEHSLPKQLSLVLVIDGIIKASSARSFISAISPVLLEIDQFFILINSIFGVAGQLTKDIVFNEFFSFWPLFLAVLVGGQIGNLLNIKFLSNKTLAIATSLLVIFVAVRMGFKLLS